MYKASKIATKIKDKYKSKVLKGETLDDKGVLKLGNNVPEKMGNIEAYIKRGGTNAVDWALKGKKAGTREYMNSVKALEGLGLVDSKGYTSKANSMAISKKVEDKKFAKERKARMKNESWTEGVKDIGRGVGQSLSDLGNGALELVGMDRTQARKESDAYYEARKSDIAHGAGYLAGEIATIAVPGGAIGKGLTKIPKIAKAINTGRKAFIAGAALDTGISAGEAALRAKRGNKLQAAGTDAIYGIATMGLGKVISKLSKKGGKMDALGKFLSEPISINKSAVKKEINASNATIAEKIKANKEVDKIKEKASKVNTTKLSYNKDKLPLRPAIVKPGKDGKLKVIQGTGRFSNNKSNTFDVFVPKGTQVPKGSKLIKDNVDVSEVKRLNIMSSRGAEGENPNLVNLVTKGNNKWSHYKVDTKNIDAPLKNNNIVDKSSNNNYTGHQLYKELGGKGIKATEVKKVTKKLYGTDSLKLLSYKQLLNVRSKFIDTPLVASTKPKFTDTEFEAIKKLGFNKDKLTKGQLLKVKSKAKQIEEDLVDSSKLSKEGDISKTRKIIEGNLGVPPGVLDKNPLFRDKYHAIRHATNEADLATKTFEQDVIMAIKGLSNKERKKLTIYGLIQQGGLELARRAGYTGKEFQLSGKTAEAYQNILDIFKEKGDELVKAGLLKKGQVIDGYFPILKDTTNSQGNDVIDSLGDILNGKAGILKERVGGGTHDIDNDLMSIVRRYGRAANTELHIKPVVRRIEDWIENTGANATHPVLSAYIKDLGKFVVEGVDKVNNKVLNSLIKVKNNAQIVTLALKPITGLLTLESTATGLAKNPGLIKKGIINSFKKPKYALDGKSIIDGDASSLSTEYWKRERDPTMHTEINLDTSFDEIKDSLVDANGNISLNKNTYKKLEEISSNLGMQFIKVLDALSYKITFNTSYYTGLKKGLSTKDAINYADDIAIKTHSSADRTSRPGVQRTELGKFATGFLTPVLVSVIDKAKTFGRAAVLDEGVKQSVQNVAALSLLTYGVNSLYSDVLKIHYPAFNPADLAIASSKLIKGDIKGFDDTMARFEDSLPGLGDVIKTARIGTEEGASLQMMGTLLSDSLAKDSSRVIGLGGKMAFKYIRDGISAIGEASKPENERILTDAQIKSKIFKFIALTIPVTAPLSVLGQRYYDTKSLNYSQTETDKTNYYNDNTGIPVLQYNDGGIKNSAAKTFIGVSPYSTEGGSKTFEQGARNNIRKTIQKNNKDRENTIKYNELKTYLNNGGNITALQGKALRKEYPKVYNGLKDLKLANDNGLTKSNIRNIYSNGIKDKIILSAQAALRLQNMKDNGYSEEEINNELLEYKKNGLFDPRYKNEIKYTIDQIK